MNGKNPGAGRSGRPRGFDRDEAIGHALQLFRRHGCESASVADLAAAIGIASPSLYAVSPARRGCLGRRSTGYVREGSAALERPLATATPLEDGTRALLQSTVGAVLDAKAACLVSNGMLHCGAEHAALAQLVSSRWPGMLAKIRKGLGRWFPMSEAETKAHLLLAVLQGLPSQASDGAERGLLDKVAGLAVRSVVDA